MKHRADMLTPAQDSALESPSQDHGPRFGYDQQIRNRGYAIKSRAKDQEPIWERNGFLFTHSEVIRREKIGIEKCTRNPRSNPS